MTRKLNLENKINNELAMLTILYGCGTKREGMLVDNLSDDLLQEIVKIKAVAKVLPISMRKFYMYKIASTKKNAPNNNPSSLFIYKQMYDNKNS